ncbi:MAG: hypothetical protein HQL51_02630 [Magnetococcales bacterium]|nr:hypothetical protein [Magnetococcales bacterium]
MAVPQTISLPIIPQGWYMSWNMYTQAAYNICVTLKDSSTTYVNNVCRSNTAFGSLSSGFQQVAGSNMTLTITIAQSSGVQVVSIPFQVPSTSGAIVGAGYNIAVEDAGDQDFNDLSISITAWKSRG